MITIKRGDLLKAEETVIAHQVNCFGVAGGLASAVFEKWPDAENDYTQAVQRFGPRLLFGHCQLTGQQSDGHIIANLFGQYHPGADYRPIELAVALFRLGQFARAKGWSVALPYKLSCGICGGNWNEVLGIIEEAMDGVECTIYQREGD